VSADRNSVLKLKFQALHSAIVDNVNATDVVDFLFHERVLGKEDTRELHLEKDPQQQCRDLLALLHTSENRQAFIHFYHAIKNEPHLQWLIDRIDEYRDQSVTTLVQQRYINDKRGKELFQQCVNLNKGL